MPGVGQVHGDPDVDAVAPDSVRGRGAHDHAAAGIVELQSAERRHELPRAEVDVGAAARRDARAEGHAEARAPRPAGGRQKAARRGSSGASTSALRDEGSTPSRSAT